MILIILPLVAGRGHPAPVLLDVIIEESMTEKNGRIEIPQNVAAELLFLADRTCCVCRQRLRPIQIHHIDDDPTNSVIENLAVVNTCAYHIRLSNVGHASVSGCVLQSEGPNTDGIHVDGPANDIAVSNCNITTDDDAIAFNCPEGESGDISRLRMP